MPSEIAGKAIKERWTVKRSLEQDPFGKTLPAWAQHLMFGLYRELGWSAADQQQNGKIAATGAWGDELFLLVDGTIGCTEYPKDFPHE